MSVSMTRSGGSLYVGMWIDTNGAVAGSYGGGPSPRRDHTIRQRALKPSYAYIRVRESAASSKSSRLAERNIATRPRPLRKVRAKT